MVYQPLISIDIESTVQMFWRPNFLGLGLELGFGCQLGLDIKDYGKRNYGNNRTGIYKPIDSNTYCMQGETLPVKICNAFVVSTSISKPISDSMFMFIVVGA
jgi:hypothetical protein